MPSTSTSTQADASIAVSPLPAPGDMKLEVVALPVSDVDSWVLQEIIRRLPGR